MKTLLALAFSLFALTASAQTKLTWSHNTPEDRVEKYIIQHKTDLEPEWKSVEVLMP